MNQPIATVAAIDPHRPREPLLLSHYTLPSLYQRAKDFADKEQYVPLPVSTVAVYYIQRYGQQFIDHWRKHTGPDLFSHASSRIHSVMARDLEEISHPHRLTDRNLIPLPSMMPIKLFQAAISFQDARAITAVWECYCYYLKAIDNVPDMRHMAELLYEPFAMLDHYKDRLTPAALGNYHKLLQFALSRQTLPAQALAMALEHHGDEIGHLALNLTDMPLAERPQLDDVDGKRTPTTPVEEVSECVEFTAEVLDPEDMVDKYVDHLDGSTGLSVQRELKELFAPRLDAHPDPQVMFEATAKLHEGVWLEAIQLWWKMCRNRVDPEEEAREAWVLDCTARFLERAFTEEQFATLTEVLSAQELVDRSQQFILGSVGNEPELSWQQIRISIVSISLARVAHITDTPLIDFAVEMYEAAELHDEIPLLRATLDAMQEQLEDQAKSQMVKSKTARRH